MWIVAVISVVASFAVCGYDIYLWWKSRTTGDMVWALIMFTCALINIGNTIFFFLNKEVRYVLSYFGEY